jgi:hypothetical protein
LAFILPFGLEVNLFGLDVNEEPQRKAKVAMFHVKRVRTGGGDRRRYEPALRGFSCDLMFHVKHMPESSGGFFNAPAIRGRIEIETSGSSQRVELRRPPPVCSSH